MRALSLSCIVLGAAMFLAACGSSGRPGSGEGIPIAGVVEVSAFEWGYEPEAITIPLGEEVRINLTNDGEAYHNLKIDDLEAQGIQSDTDELFVEMGSGEGGSLAFTPAETGQFEFYCTISGHRGRGMEGTLIVE